MERQNPISVTIVDRNYPPSKSVTAESASDLAKYLIEHDINVDVVHTDGQYQGGGSEGEIVGNTHKVPAVYNGKQKLIRLISSLIEGFLLIRKARKVNKGIVIVMTSPPLLNYWASVLLGSKNIPWIYWSMDVYPQAFVSGGLIKENNILYKYFHKKTYENPPVAMISLGHRQGQYLENEFKTNIDQATLPCGVFLYHKNGTSQEEIKPTWKKDDSKIYLGYIGNLGEAHSTTFLKNIVDHFDAEKQTLVFVLYGSKAQKVIEYIKKKNNDSIILLDSLPRNELKHIDIHLVSLKSEWVNICVPSKLVSAVHKESIFLFHGIKECDSWEYLQTAGWIIEEGENDKQEIQKFLKTITHKNIEEKKLAAIAMSQHLTDNTQKAYDDIVHILKDKHQKHLQSI